MLHLIKNRHHLTDVPSQPQDQQNGLFKYPKTVPAASSNVCAQRALCKYHIPAFSQPLHFGNHHSIEYNVKVPALQRLTLTGRFVLQAATVSSYPATCLVSDLATS
jgi:hypothetical protein